MVLSDLGRRLTTAFRDLQGSAPIDEKVYIPHSFFCFLLTHVCSNLMSLSKKSALLFSSPMSMSVQFSLSENLSNIKSTLKISLLAQIENVTLPKRCLMNLSLWSIHMKSRMNQNRRRPMSSCWLGCKEQEKPQLVQRYYLQTMSANLRSQRCIISDEDSNLASSVQTHFGRGPSIN